MINQTRYEASEMYKYSSPNLFGVSLFVHNSIYIIDLSRQDGCHLAQILQARPYDQHPSCVRTDAPFGSIPITILTLGQPASVYTGRRIEGSGCTRSSSSNGWSVTQIVRGGLYNRRSKRSSLYYTTCAAWSPSTSCSHSPKKARV